MTSSLIYSSLKNPIFRTNPQPIIKTLLCRRRYTTKLVVGDGVMNSSQPPWLMLPPVFEGEMVYKFYSLADGRILSFNKRHGGGGGGGSDSDEIPPDSAKFSGSSHGWLASHDEKGESGNHHVFLSNPISGRHLRLPPYPWDPPRVSLSCSPDEQRCRAVTVHPYPAFCLPRVSTEWTLMQHKRYERYLSYDDFAYCTTRKVFTFISNSDFEFDSECVGVDCKSRTPHHQIDDWNLDDEERIETTWFWKYQGVPHSWKENEDVELLTNHCYQKLHLIYAADHFDLPLIVVWCTMRKPPHQTAGFVVVQIEKRGNDCCTKGCIKVVEDLKGLAIFVGEKNQSFAVPASDFPGILKPNSIYFARGSHESSIYIRPKEKRFFDVGIFNYEKKTIVPVCGDEYFPGGGVYYPMWFTPNTC